MSIRVLPKATSHLLGSAQVLTTPESLVKELLDNALDAKATSIDVVISANTLDRIEVRDNGHGIAPADLDALGRRGYTSKLRKFEDVKAIGGSTLGFRGEALASATELGEISVTTRTDGESVAAKVKLGSHGGVASQISTSHPIGTTVCVLNFFSKLPVRKENALKVAKKALSRIKELLQSYVLARLNIRFSLKVLKQKNSSWLFAPGTNDGIREIVSQAIGRDIAAQCTEEFGTLSIPTQPGMTVSETGFNAQTVPYDDGRTQKRRNTEFVMHAFIPKLDADFSKTVGGQYLSIDSRPVSCARGTLKKIVGVYKSAIRAVAADTISEKLKNPFIRLDIMCPPGSYDANVEPAKDNVLFEDESLLLSLVERWFKSIYVCRGPSSGILVQQSQEQEDNTGLIHPPRKIRFVGASAVDISRSSNPCTGERFQEIVSDIPKNSTFVLEFDGESPKPPPDINPSSRQTEVIGVTNFMDDRESRIDMSEDLSEEASASNLTKGSVHELPESQIEPSETNNSLNPWLIAKLNAAVTTKLARGSSLFSSMPTPNKRRLARRHDLANSYESSMLPEPYHTPTRGGTPEKPLTSSINSENSLEIWLKQSQADHLQNSDTAQMDPPTFPGNSSRSKIMSSQGNFVTARQKLYETPWSPPATPGEVASNRSGEYDNPFMPPFMKSQPTRAQPPFLEKCSFINAHSSRISHIEEATLAIVCNTTMQENRHEKRLQANVDDALDFEKRKEAATRKLREERRSRSKAEALSSIVADDKPSSPLKDAGNASLDARQKQSTIETFPEKVPFKTCLPDDDPRAYLMRKQQSIAVYSERPETAPKLKRAKTLLLPLENVPRSAETHNLVQVVFTDVSLIKKAMLGLKPHDEYSYSGCQARGLDISSADLMGTQRKLQNILKVWLHVTTGE